MAIHCEKNESMYGMKSSKWEEIDRGLDVYWRFQNISYSYEKEGGRHKDARKMDVFNSLISDMDLVDIGFKGNPFRCCNNKDNEDRIRERL